MITVLGPNLPVKPVPIMPSAAQPALQSPPKSPKKQAGVGDYQHLPSILDMRLHEWIQKLTTVHGGAFPNGISPKQLETLAHAQWAAAIRSGRNVRPAWRGSNHLSALLSNEVRAGRLIRLQKACYIGCDSRVHGPRPPHQFRTSTFEVTCSICRHPMKATQSISLKCKGCGIHVHAECAYNQRRVPMALVAGSKQWSEHWHCLNCKRCNICGSTDTKEGLLCRNCDSMEHVRCQRSFDMDLSYKFWSCSLCVKSNVPCVPFTPAIHPAVNSDTLKAPAFAVQAPDSSQNGISPIEFIRQGSEDKGIEDRNGTHRSAFHLSFSPAPLYQLNQFLSQSPFFQNTNLSPEGNDGRKFLGLPARPAAENELKEGSSQSVGAQETPSENTSTTNTSSPPIADPVGILAVKTWSVEQVAMFFRELGYSDCAAVFKREEIDGAALLLMERGDIFARLGLKMGPALKTYKAVRRLQKAFSRIKTPKS